MLDNFQSLCYNTDRKQKGDKKMYYTILYYKDWPVHTSKKFETWEEANNWGKEHIRKKHGSNKHKWYKIKAD